MVRPMGLAGLFGFGEDEAESLCGEFGMEPAEIISRCGGYKLGSERLRVCCPGSVARALSSKRHDGGEADFEACTVLRQCVDADFDDMASDFVRLACGAGCGGTAWTGAPTLQLTSAARAMRSRRSSTSAS